MSIQDLREQLAAKAKAVNEIANKKDWNAERDQPLYEAGLSEMDGIKARIANITAVNERMAEEALNNSVIGAADKAAQGPQVRRLPGVRRLDAQRRRRSLG
jgi:hypothetical protein